MRIVSSAGAFLFFLAYAILVTRPLAWRAATHTLIGPDPLSHLWMVSWLTGHAFQPGQLFRGNIFFPSAHAALFTDLSLGTAILVLPLRLLTTEPVILFNAATILALAFGGWAFHALAFELTRDRWSALLAGCLAAFSQHQLSHVYHLNLLSIGWLALFLLGLHRIVERPSAWAAALAGVSFALTAQSSGYYGVSAVVIAIVFGAFHARALAFRRTAAMTLLAAGVALALTLPYLLQFHELQVVEGVRRPPGLSAQMSFQPARDLTSGAYAYRRLVGEDGELLFPGLLTLALAAVALVRRVREAVFYAAAAGALVVLSLGPELTVAGRTVPMPYQWLFAIPPFDSMRHPFTFAAVALLLLAVLAGMGWARCGLSRRRFSGPAIIVIAALEMLTEAPRLRPIPPGVPESYRMIAALPPGAILEIPVFSEESVLWAARHGMPVVNGIGAFAPAQTMVLDRYVRNHWLERVPEDVDTSRPTPYLLGRFRVRYVIIPIGRVAWLRPLAAAFDRSSLFRFVAEAPGGERIYEVAAAR